MRLSEVYEYIILLFLVRSKETIFEIFVNMILWAFPCQQLGHRMAEDSRARFLKTINPSFPQRQLTLELFSKT